MEPGLRIGLDVSAADRPGGVGTYACELVEALGRVGEGVRLHLWSDSARSAALVRPLAPTVAVHHVAVGPRRHLAAAARLRLLPWLSPVDLVGAVDVFHALGYFLPVRGAGTPLIATIHDLSALHHPGWHTWKRVLAHRAALGRTARASARVLTPTEAIREQVIEDLRVHPDRVSAIHYGVAERFRSPATAGADEVLARYGLRAGHYLCFTGALEPRKNLGRLLDALAIARGRRADLPPLVIAGPAGWRNAELRRRIDGRHVRALGFVPADDVVALLAGALVFLYPSLYEGFGLPPLEAMACGAPVLASTDPALREVLGDHAVLVDAREPEAIAEGLLALVDDTARRADLARRGRVHARAFTWDRTAIRTLEVYRECARPAALV